MQKNNPKLDSIKEKIFWLLTLSLFLFVSTHNFISHSEYWAIASGRLMGTLTGESLALYYKSLFYLILKIPYFFKLNNVEHIIISRALFGAVAFLCFYIFLKNCQRVTRNKNIYLFMGIFLISFQIYFYNVYRIRADLLATLFVLLAYNRINTIFLKNNSVKSFDFKIFLFYCAAFLCTPKSIYLLLTLFIYQSFLFCKPPRLKNIFLSFINLFLAPIAIILAAFSLIRLFHEIDVHPHAMALLYQLQSFQQNNDPQPWGHILTSLKINFFHYGLIVLGLTFYFIKRLSEKKNNKLHDAQLLLAFCTLGILAIHNEKWTYFIAQLIPFLSLPALLFFKQIHGQRTIQSIVLVLLLSTPFLITNHYSWFRSNQNQLLAIEELENLVSKIPNATYFDSMGILPRANGKMWFLGPNDDASRTHTISNLKFNPPDFVFYTSKLNIAYSDITIFLYKNYHEVSLDVWLIKEKTDAIKESEINLRKGGLRTLFIYDYLPYLKPFPVLF